MYQSYYYTNKVTAHHDQLVHIIVIFFLFLSNCWSAISGFVLHMGDTTRIPIGFLLAVFFIVIVFYGNTLRPFKTVIIYFTTLIVFTLINLFFQGVKFTTFDLSLLDVVGRLLYCYIFFIVLLWSLKRSFLNTMYAMSCSSLLVCLFYIANTGMKEFGASDNLSLRLLSSVINANEVAYCATATIFVTICITHFEIHKKSVLRNCFLLIVIAISFWLIIATACRTAFITISIILFGYLIIFFRNRFSTAKTIVLSLIILIIVVFTRETIISNTIVGKRLSKGIEWETEMYEQKFGGDSWWIDQFLGERAVYFHDGYKIFQQSPWFGIGYKNYMFYSSTHNVCHIEYISQLAEGGIVGFVLYMFFLSCVIKNCYQTARNKGLFNQITILGFCGLTATMLFGFGLFTINQFPFYISCATTLALTSSSQKENQYAEIPCCDFNEQHPL